MDIYELLSGITKPEKFGKNSVEFDLIGQRALATGRVHHGASKMVYVPNEGDYVYKIGFDGISADYDEEGAFYEWESLTSYVDYEAELWNNANAHGLGEIFAKSEYFDTINGFEVYCQLKCDQDGYTLSGITDEEIENTRDLYNSYMEVVTRRVFVKLINDYGMELMDKFMHFTEEEDVNDIWDSRNFGYREGKLVFFDYSGYYEEF